MAVQKSLRSFHIRVHFSNNDVEIMDTRSNNSVYIMGITKIILIANQFCSTIHIFCKSVASFKLSTIVYILSCIQ